MAVFTLLVIALLCLIFKSTRLAGVVGLTLLALLYPIVFIVLLAHGAVVLYYIRKHKRRKQNEQSKLP